MAPSIPRLTAHHNHHAATLVASGVTKTLGSRTLLRDVSVTLSAGRKVGVVASNGTGKSTLLRVLAGIDDADSGRIELAPKSATVGYLAQEPSRIAGETMRRFLARRTGILAASEELEAAAAALGAHTGLAADERYEHALERYLALGAADFEANAEQVCAQLGLDEHLFDVHMTALSGGQAARASLASVLLSRYDIFLLDEPTNDLDFDGLAILEQFVAELPVACAVVSHDRAFLERTIDAVLEIDDHEHTATEFRGGWVAYLEERAVARRHAEEAYATYRDRRDQLGSRAQREREWATKGVNKAKRSGETDKFIRQFQRASSEQLAGKANRTEQAMNRLEVVDKPWEGWQLRFEILAAPRSGAVCMNLTGARVTLGDFTLGPVTMEIRSGERVAIIGRNGSGKSTLIRALLADQGLDAGQRLVGPGVVIGTLAQSRARFGEAPLLDGFVAETGLSISDARTLLAKFALGAEHVVRRADSLSPGERTRAELALLMAVGVNCVVLDEPTNHLDLTAIEQLETALSTYDGTLIVVSHDRRFVESIHPNRRIELDAGAIVRDEAWE